MDRDPFGHRKYHGLYFILGFLIAFVAFMMLSGCEQATSSAGVGESCCEPEPVVCCQALIPSCMACADSCSVDVWLEKTCGLDAIDAEYAGWDEINNEPIWLCKAEIID